MPFLLGLFSFVRNSWIGKALAIAGGVLMAVLLVFSAGKRAQRGKTKVANLENHIDIQARIDATKEDAARRVGVLSDDELDSKLSKHGAIRK